MRIQSNWSQVTVALTLACVACTPNAGDGSTARDGGGTLADNTSPPPEHVLCQAELPVVRASANPQGGRIENRRARVSYPAGAYSGSDRLQLRTPPSREHGVALRPSGNTAGSDTVWLRLNVPGCQVGPPPYFVDYNGSLYPAEEKQEGTVRWGVAVLPRSTITAMQVDTMGTTISGFVILSN